MFLGGGDKSTDIQQFDKDGYIHAILFDHK